MELLLEKARLVFGERNRVDGRAFLARSL